MECIIITGIHETAFVWKQLYLYYLNKWITSVQILLFSFWSGSHIISLKSGPRTNQY